VTFKHLKDLSEPSTFKGSLLGISFQHPFFKFPEVQGSYLIIGPQFEEISTNRRTRDPSTEAGAG